MRDLLLLSHQTLDEFLIVDLTVSILSTLEDDLDFLNGELLTQSGQNVTDLSAHNGTVALLVEDTETLNEILEGTLLLSLGNNLDEAQELVEVAGLGVHLLLLWVTQNTGDILVGGLEAKAADKVTNLFYISLISSIISSYLVKEKFALASSVVKVETVLDIFNLILGKVNLNLTIKPHFYFFMKLYLKAYPKFYLEFTNI